MIGHVELPTGVRLELAAFALAQGAPGHASRGATLAP